MILFRFIVKSLYLCLYFGLPARQCVLKGCTVTALLSYSSTVCMISFQEHIIAFVFTRQGTACIKLVPFYTRINIFIFILTFSHIDWKVRGLWLCMQMSCWPCTVWLLSCVHAIDNANFFSLLSAIQVIADTDPFYFFCTSCRKSLSTICLHLQVTGRWAGEQLNLGTEVSVNSNSIVTMSVSIDTAKICSFVVVHALSVFVP